MLSEMISPPNPKSLRSIPCSTVGEKTARRPSIALYWASETMIAGIPWLMAVAKG